MTPEHAHAFSDLVAVAKEMSARLKAMGHHDFTEELAAIGETLAEPFDEAKKILEAEAAADEAHKIALAKIPDKYPLNSPERPSAFEEPEPEPHPIVNYPPKNQTEDPNKDKPELKNPEALQPPAAHAVTDSPK